MHRYSHWLRVEMSDEKETWVAFSEIGINARMRNALELFARRSPTHGPGSKLLPAAAGRALGSEDAAGLNSREDVTASGEETAAKRRIV